MPDEENLTLEVKLVTTAHDTEWNELLVVEEVIARQSVREPLRDVFGAYDTLD